MDAEKAITLANQYGISTVLCIIMVGVLVWVLMKVFDANAKRETAYATFINTGMANLATNMGHLSENLASNTSMCQELARNMKDGFDAMRSADNYQREEHRKMLSAIDNVECKAK